MVSRTLSLLCEGKVGGEVCVEMMREKAGKGKCRTGFLEDLRFGCRLEGYGFSRIFVRARKRR